MGEKKPKQTQQEQPKPDQPAAPKVEFRMVSLDLIDDPEAPMRNDLSPANVEELVLSIKQVGLIEPVILKEKAGRYEVIAGHRRTYASRLAKLAEIACHIRIADNEETEMLKIHENLYRLDISPWEEAKHFSYLIDKQKLTPTRISQLISKSLSYVTDRLRILEYPDFLSEAMHNGEITFSVAREFAQFDDLKQMQTAVYYAKRGGMTQEMAHKWVQDYKRTKEHKELNEIVTVNPANGAAETHHTATCVYCREQVELYMAEIVYMHSQCLQSANSQTVAETPQQT